MNKMDGNKVKQTEVRVHGQMLGRTKKWCENKRKVDVGGEEKKYN